MDSKSLTGIEIKDEAKGEVEAVFATLNVKDKDDDVTAPGAFENGAPVVISAYGHKTWEGALPVGKGTIHEIGDQVVLKGQFFLNTTQGRDTFEVVKQLGDRQEWSYGFKVEDSENAEFEGKAVRMLKKMSVFEVSPVMRGAGVGTRTTYAKGEKDATLADEISDAMDVVDGVVESAKRVVALRAQKGKSLSQVNLKGLNELFSKFSSLMTELGYQSVTTEEIKDEGAELRKLFLESVKATLEGE